jgi:hypothetical protein
MFGGRRWRLAIALVLGAGVGCGDKDGAGGTAGETGTDSSTAGDESADGGGTDGGATDGGGSDGGGTGGETGGTTTSGAGSTGGSGGGTGTGTGADTGTDTGADNSAVCEARGGTCEPVADLSTPCPDGFYDPFSGGLAFCRTAPVERCCVPEGGVGSPCGVTEDCVDLGCLSEGSGYPTGGVCSGACEPLQQNCPEFAECLTVFFSAAMGVCMVSCQGDEWCREGWSCQAFPKNPFAAEKDTTYVCWETGIGMSMAGLGEPCATHDDCLSLYCLADPADSVDRCTSVCDDARPCLAGFHCEPQVGCPTPGCGTCFPL